MANDSLQVQVNQRLDFYQHQLSDSRNASVNQHSTFINSSCIVHHCLQIINHEAVTIQTSKLLAAMLV
jgi:hypothetical protein